MSRRSPRRRPLYLLVQAQGMVGVITGAVAAALAAVAVFPSGSMFVWVARGIAFAVTVGVLFAYWQRSLTRLQSAIRPLHPTAPDEVDAPF